MLDCYQYTGGLVCYQYTGGLDCYQCTGGLVHVQGDGAGGLSNLDYDAAIT